MARILREDAVFVTGLRRFPLLLSRGKFLCRHVELDQSPVLIEGD
jgi:hypothetical protein